MPEKRIVLRNCGVIDPKRITTYLDRDGFKALTKARDTMTPEEVIEEIKSSGLRGRGGAGFPSGLKWELARKAQGDDKYVICNADEGEVGTFKDRHIMEGDPFTLIEAMAIAGYTIGSSCGYIYARAEYPLAVRRLKLAIEQAKELRLLGDDILGSGFSFNIEIMQGAGAFVCGEGSALMYSIEGKRGMPRVRPPRSVASGLWELPTSLNNVETFANVPPIITKGGELVNVIPSDVTLETFVRGAGIEAIEKAAEKVDRCIRAGALALGAEVRIRTLPGYLPMLEA